MLEIDHCEQLTDQAALKMEKLRKILLHHFMYVYAVALCVALLLLNPPPPLNLEEEKK